MGFSLGFRPVGTLQTLDLRSTCTVTDLVPKYRKDAANASWLIKLAGIADAGDVQFE